MDYCPGHYLHDQQIPSAWPTRLELESFIRTHCGYRMETVRLGGGGGGGGGCMGMLISASRCHFKQYMRKPLACPGSLHFQLIGRDQLPFAVVDDCIASDADIAASLQKHSTLVIRNAHVTCNVELQEIQDNPQHPITHGRGAVQ